MRSPIFVRSEHFDLDGVAAEIDTIRNSFDSYLDNYPVKSMRSKYSLMGPVGKVLQEARTGNWDAKSLIGYAINIHLSNPKANAYISQEARESLEDGICRLLSLLKIVPATVQDKVLDQVDYGLYFIRRVKGLERLGKIRDDFIKFLWVKYGKAENLVEAWGGKFEDYGEDFNKVKYPSKKVYAEASGQKKDDIAEFVQQSRLKGYELVDEEEI